MVPEKWKRAHCRDRLIALAKHLCHEEVKKGGELYKLLKSSPTLNFLCLHWYCYAEDIVTNAGNLQGFNGRSLDQDPFFLQSCIGPNERLEIPEPQIEEKEKQAEDPDARGSAREGAPSREEMPAAAQAQEEKESSGDDIF